MNKETFRFGESDSDHVVDDEDCEACWGNPERCECGGLIHTEFGDENSDGD